MGWDNPSGSGVDPGSFSSSSRGPSGSPSYGTWVPRQKRGCVAERTLPMVRMRQEQIVRVTDSTGGTEQVTDRQWEPHPLNLIPAHSEREWEFGGHLAPLSLIHPNGDRIEAALLEGAQHGAEWKLLSWRFHTGSPRVAVLSVSLVFAESATTSVSHGPSHSFAVMSFPCSSLPALSQISEAGRDGRDEKRPIKALRH